MQAELVGQPGPDQVNTHYVSLILIQLQAHDRPLSLAELRAATGLLKSVLLRVLTVAEHRGEVARVGQLQWIAGEPT
ncbi:hypothetical protein [Roseomonas elaeocarpi]|uniref:HTH iclR-type domain-containing protein n=1 Tax=Roseomonas elaeocarpi TaxID=907779 RepID=A0ABV6JM15_9PROT